MNDTTDSRAHLIAHVASNLLAGVNQGKQDADTNAAIERAIESARKIVDRAHQVAN